MSESYHQNQGEAACNMNESIAYSESLSGSIDSKKSKIYLRGSVQSITEIP
jgi:hypothetical protein